MSIKLQLPKLTDLRPRITVIGVGGAGCNAINNMISAGLNGVDFVVANTDAQALSASSAEHRIQLGASLTEGLGAGSKPEIGQAAAEEAVDDIRTQVQGSHMVFIAAGMGGGTGTGAAAVIARVAKDLGILTVAVVTKPFQFEGARRMRIAEVGVVELRKHVDTLIVIPNQNLFRVANEKTTFEEAFVLADQVLYSGVACIVDLIVKEGLINLDFADVRTVMTGMGTAMMGTGEAEGDDRAIRAAEEAIANPLLDDVTLKGARGLLLSITGGRNLTLYEVDEAASRVREEVDPEANIIVGATHDEALGNKVRVSIVASGMSRVGEKAMSPTGAAVQARRPGRVTRAEGAPYEPAYGAEPPRQAAYAGDDVQRRLSAALQPDDQADAEEWSDETEHAPSPHNGRTWRGPGNVTIEDGTSAGSHDMHSAPPRMTDGMTQPLGSNTFQPSPPAESRRSQRRMPDVEDFPPIGQQEYRAKKGFDWHGGTDRAPPAPKRRMGFFDRLTGRSRRAADSQHDESFGAPQRGEQQPMSHGPGEAELPEGPRERTSRAHENHELPVFFGNKRR